MWKWGILLRFGITLPLCLSCFEMGSQGNMCLILFSRQLCPADVSFIILKAVSGEGSAVAG